MNEHKKQPNSQPSRGGAIIILDRDRFGAMDLLLPADWPEESNGTIISAATEYSIIQYLANQIRLIVHDRQELCAHHIDEVLALFSFDPAWMAKDHFFAQVPSLHVTINGFLGHLKSLLDTLVQLFYTQRIVTNSVHGFHKENGVPGKKVLNALRNNARAEFKQTAQQLVELLERAKSEWIDRVVFHRDELIHKRGYVSTNV
jgi:hypothetical protein